jgi:hypothetical protein
MNSGGVKLVLSAQTKFLVSFSVLENDTLNQAELNEIKMNENN